MFRIHRTTIEKSKYQVCGAINEVLKSNIKFPMSHEGLATLAAGFASISSGRGGVIPNVVAAVDSVCVQRKAPTITSNSAVSCAYNRKGYFASSFLAFVDAECRFLSVSMPCYSSSHDSTLFACSKVLGVPSTTFSFFLSYFFLMHFTCSSDDKSQMAVSVTSGLLLAMMLSSARTTLSHPTSESVFPKLSATTTTSCR